MTPLAPILAHETWFIHGDHPLDWSFAGETTTLALLAGAVGLTGLVRLLAKRWPGVDIPVLARLAPYMPFAIRIQLTVSLINLLSLNYFLSPTIHLQTDVIHITLRAVITVVTVAITTN